LKLAVVLFNLGGPDSPEAVQPFLENLFSDRAILPLPTWARRPLARIISRRRAPTAKAIYDHIGGRSPLLEETIAQAQALERELVNRQISAKVFVAMRAWHPMSDQTAREVAAYAPEMCALLPLYPQFSTTTSASSLQAWRQAAARAGLCVEQKRVCCYPWDDGFATALAEQVRASLSRRKAAQSYRVLFSAHGLPQRVVARGDPYQWQVERTVDAVLKRIGDTDLDWRISYQSRVGPLKWLQPSTDAEIRLAGSEGKGVVIVPVAFVSEHSETLVELDIEYAGIAREAGVPDYIRAPTVGTSGPFIRGLADLALRAATAREPITCGTGRICPERFAFCGMNEARS